VALTLRWGFATVSLDMPPRRGSSDRTAATELLQRIERRTARLGVIGLGYVGLPLATELGQAGFRVTGLDIDERRVAELAKGHSYIQDVPSRLVKDLIRSGNFHPTADFSTLKQLDVVNVCVPTPLSKQRDPDVSYIVSAAKQVARHLHRGMLVILESTTYPGTTEELILPMLQETGMKVGRDFFLAFSPERVDPGNPKFHTRNIPKVVGGVTPTCTEVAVKLYQQRLDHVVPVSSTQVAEMVKLLENTFRSVNIGLVNELALMCTRMKIDVWEVIEAAATKPFGFMPFYPGPGLGGHCIPIDPFYLSWKARASGFEARFIELAGHVNGHMPEHVVDLVSQSLNNQGKAVHGARVDYSDPHVPQLVLGEKRLRSVPLTPARIRAYDCVVIATAHRDLPLGEVARHARGIVDTRNALRGRKSKKIVRI
jgi:UDP-N-acetyl-D-glucosamine dehydrogenase